MRSITDVIRHLKQNWTSELCPEAIERACREQGMVWRQSTLNPIVTVQVFFLQILYGNTACTHLPRLANLCFSAAAYCKARMRLKLKVLELLLQRSVEQLHKDPFDTSRWLGHRIFFLDHDSHITWGEECAGPQGKNEEVDPLNNKSACDGRIGGPVNGG